MSQYLERAQKVIRDAGARLDRRKGECVDCKWRNKGVIEDHCRNPVVILATETVEQGYGREALAKCDEQRRVSSHRGPVVCGPDGDLFEPDDRLFSLLRRLFR